MKHKEYEIDEKLLIELIKVDSYIKDVNKTRKKKIHYVLSGHTTLKLLGMSSVILNKILIDISHKKGDKRVGRAFTEKMKKDGLSNVKVFDVKKAETINKNNSIIKIDSGELVIPTHEKLLINLNTYGFLPDEGDRIYRKLSKVIDLNQLLKIVEFNRNNNLNISEQTRKLLSTKLKPEKKPLTRSEKKLVDKVLNSLKNNGKLVLYGGLVVEKKVDQNTRATFDIDLMGKPEQVEKVQKALKNNQIKFKDKYSNKEKNFKIIKVGNIEKTTIEILDDENLTKKETLKIDLVHPKVDISENRLLTTGNKNDINMINRETLLCIKLNVIFENIQKNNNKGWKKDIVKNILDVCLLDFDDNLNINKLKKVYLELNKIDFINIDWSKKELLKNIIEKNQRFENIMRNWIRTNDINPHFKTGGFKTINKYVDILEELVVKDKQKTKNTKVIEQ